MSEQGAEKRDAIQEPGWPARRLKRWPIAVDWEPEVLKKRIGPIGYQKVVGTVRALFSDRALSSVLEGFQDYCFQQGETSNANPRDRAFFYDVLTHDLTFFEGDKGRPIVDDLPIDPKIYDALPQMKGSHLDLFRVKRRSAFGGLTLVSLLTGEEAKAGTRLFKGPRVDERVLGRLVKIGRGLFLDDPHLSVSPPVAEAVVTAVLAEHAALSERRSGLSLKGLLKVGGYHLYEETVGRVLVEQLTKQLPSDLPFEPQVIRHRLRTGRDVPALESLAGAKVVDTGPGGKPAIIVIDAFPNTNLPPTLKEVMISIEEREVMTISFLGGAAAEQLRSICEAMPVSALEDRESLSVLSVYRSLRHTIKGT